MREVIIFGRSPFINSVNVDALLARYKTIGLNSFGQVYPVDYLFAFDVYYPPSSHRAGELFCPHWLLNGPGTGIVPKAGKPLFDKGYQSVVPNGPMFLMLGLAYFTASLAVNWAVLEGFKKIYLVGIDHVETDTGFHHFDNGAEEAGLTHFTPESHRALKKFVTQCARAAEIYQCNPAVRDDWDLPYKDIAELYDIPSHPAIRLQTDSRQ